MENSKNVCFQTWHFNKSTCKYAFSIHVTRLFAGFLWHSAQWTYQHGVQKSILWVPFIGGHQRWKYNGNIRHPAFCRLIRYTKKSCRNKDLLFGYQTSRYDIIILIYSDIGLTQYRSRRHQQLYFITGRFHFHVPVHVCVHVPGPCSGHEHGHWTRARKRIWTRTGKWAWPFQVLDKEYL
jgi:hypothetical protein